MTYEKLDYYRRSRDTWLEEQERKRKSIKSIIGNDGNNLKRLEKTEEARMYGIEEKRRKVVVILKGNSIRSILSNDDSLEIDVRAISDIDISHKEQKILEECRKDGLIELW